MSASNNLTTDAGNSNAQTNNNVLAHSKDFQTMINVLKDMGVEDYEPRVINQLLEFSYRLLHLFYTNWSIFMMLKPLIFAIHIL